MRWLIGLTNIYNISVQLKRIGYIDAAKGLGIILIVLGHSQLPQIIIDWIFSFHVPLFFIISGFFMRKKSIIDEVKSGGKSLLLPFFIVCLLYGLKDIYYLPEIHYNSISVFINRLLQLSGYGIIGMWFLPALFLCRIYYQLLATLNRYIQLCGALLLFSFAIFINVTYNEFIISYVVNSLASLIFLLVGKSFWDSGILNYRISINGKVLSVLVLLLGFIFPIDMFTCTFPLYVFSIVTSALLSYLIIKMLRGMDSYNGYRGVLFSALEFYGKDSLLILCFHAVFHYLIKDLMENFVHVYLLGTTEVIILGCLLFIWHKICKLKFVK